MASNFDEHGQPAPAFNAMRRAERDVSEVLGIAKGLLADGRIDDAEARFLHDWAATHPDAVRLWPINALVPRLKHFFADGVIDEPERAELQQLLADLVGGQASIQLGFDGSTALPLDTPPPLVGWVDEVYVFTGRFAYGTRVQCQQEALTRGAGVEDDVTRRTTFLVLGTFGSRDWIQTPYGRKIERARQLRDSGFPLRIVGEDHWAAALAKAEQIGA